MSKKVVLGFSGGLDTSFCVKYFTCDLNLEVHSITVNTGGFSKQELEEIEKHALSLGVTSHRNLDVTNEYYNDIIKFLIFGNVLKNNTYPLSVSAERVIQAIKIAEHARELKADVVAHGSTGAGNDQVRFDMIFHSLIPEMEILTPVRDLQLSRQQEIDYLKEKGVNMNFEKSVYSINKGLWGTSVGGKETLTSTGMLPEEAWPTQVSETQPRELSISFKKGEISAIDNKEFENPVEAIQYLQSISAGFGIGRDIHVGDTIIGIKGRVGFEAAAPILIIKAHHALEKHVLTKWQLTLKTQLSDFYGNWLHEGQLLDPVMRDIEAFLTSSQEHVTGKVLLQLQPYRYLIIGVDSEFDLMSSKFGSYGEMNTGWSGKDVRGFSKIFGNQTAIYQAVKKSRKNDG